ncbi:MAG: hypothetical protein ACRC1M_06655 [Methanobacteriaceae archaeon]
MKNKKTIMCVIVILVALSMISAVEAKTYTVKLSKYNYVEDGFQKDYLVVNKGKLYINDRHNWDNGKLYLDVYGKKIKKVKITYKNWKNDKNNIKLYKKFNSRYISPDIRGNYFSTKYNYLKYYVDTVSVVI